ncbi:MAG: hypothetical protein ACI9G1_001197, partial [Pirellulaceae bacterium]
AGIFQSTNTLYGTVFGLQNHRPADLIVLPKADEQLLGREYDEQQIQGMRDKIQSIQKEMQDKRIAARRAGERVIQREMVAMRNQIARLEGILGTLDENGKTRTYAMGANDLERPVDANVLVRGDVEMPAQQVARGFLQVLSDVPTDDIGPNSSGRRELASWLTSKENPLTSRVMVNRIWLHLFGDALQRSPDNWGATTAKPAHSELLDYLAIRFMQNGWSVKTLIREIVLSDTYQRSSNFNEKNNDADAENIFLWRMKPRQLDAEAFRDAMLANSGKLEFERPLGSEIAEYGNARLRFGVTEDSFSKTYYHRSIYLSVVRDMVPESLKLFDFADPNATNAKREETNVPSQALYLMNSQFVGDQAWYMASDLWGSYDSQNERIKWAFIRAYGRLPTEHEVKVSLQFFKAFTLEIAKDTPATSNSAPASVGTTQPPRRRPGGQAEERRGPRNRGRQIEQEESKLDPEQQALVMFCQGLMASAEFRVLN